MFDNLYVQLGIKLAFNILSCEKTIIKSGIIIYGICLLFLCSCVNSSQFPAHKYIKVTPNLLDKIMYEYPKHIGYIYANHDTLVFNPNHSFARYNTNKDHAFGTWKILNSRVLEIFVPTHDTIFHAQYWRRGNNLYHITYLVDCDGKDTTRHYALSKFKPLND